MIFLRIFLAPLILLLGVGLRRFVFAPYADLYGEGLNPLPHAVFLRLAFFDVAATSAFNGLAGWVMMASWPRDDKAAWKVLWWLVLMISVAALGWLEVFMRFLSLGLAGYNSLDGRLVSALGGGHPFDNGYTLLYPILPLLAYVAGAALFGLRRLLARRKR